MTVASPGREEHGSLPEAGLRRRRRHVPVVWAVPLVAALIALYLLAEQVLDYGPSIVIQFMDGKGIRPGQTDVEYRGVSVGRVESVELDPGLNAVRVKVRLRRNAEALARQDTRFWIVRLQSGLDSFSHVGEAVGTVFSGPYIAVLPGGGPPAKSFSGLETPPVIEQHGALHIVLHTAEIGSLHPGLPILYCGIEVGAVQDFGLNPKATGVDIHASIQSRYAKLVHTDSQFWNVAGGHASFSLFNGLRVEVQSLQSLLTGGIAFANPPAEKFVPASEGQEFALGRQPPSPRSPKRAHPGPPVLPGS